jgi:hypothetical protein
MFTSLSGRASRLVLALSSRVVRLGGLWQGYTFSEQEIDEARHEAWAGLGREPE